MEWRGTLSFEQQIQRLKMQHEEQCKQKRLEAELYLERLKADAAEMDKDCEKRSAENKKEYEKLRQEERRSVQYYAMQKEQLRLISQGELREVLAEKDDLKQSLQGEVMYKEEYERMKEELSAALEESKNQISMLVKTSKTREEELQEVKVPC